MLGASVCTLIDPFLDVPSVTRLLLLDICRLADSGSNRGGGLFLGLRAALEAGAAEDAVGSGVDATV
jgi:hypothetical protein